MAQMEPGWIQRASEQMDWPSPELLWTHKVWAQMSILLGSLGNNLTSPKFRFLICKMETLLRFMRVNKTTRVRGCPQCLAPTRSTGWDLLPLKPPASNSGAVLDRKSFPHLSIPSPLNSALNHEFFETACIWGAIPEFSSCLSIPFFLSKSKTLSFWDLVDGAFLVGIKLTFKSRLYSLLKIIFKKKKTQTNRKPQLFWAKLPDTPGNEHFLQPSIFIYCKEFTLQAAQQECREKRCENTLRP